MKLRLIIIMILFLTSFALADISGNISIGLNDNIKKPVYLAIWTQGQCQYFNISVLYPDFPGGCYDVKIDLFDNGKRVGEIYDPIESWKSSFYYVNRALCQRNNTFSVRAKSRNNLTAIIKLKRENSTIAIQAKAVINQFCKSDDTRVFAIVLATIAILLWALAMYVKFWK